VEAAVAAALAANAQHSRSTNTNRRKAVKLDAPQYSGKDTESLEHWFLAVETAAATQLLDDQAIIVALAMSYLTGRAKEWAYSKRLLNRNAFLSWESFCSRTGVKCTRKVTDQAVQHEVPTIARCHHVC